MQTTYGAQYEYGDEYDPYDSLSEAEGLVAQAYTAVGGGVTEWGEWDDDPDYFPEPEPNTAVQPDIILWGGVALVVMLMILGIWRWAFPAVPLVDAPPAQTDAPEPTPAPFIPGDFDPTVVIFPYDNYVLTQGPHGFSYGHAAIDISAGNGATIKSPIFGAVTQFYFDALGNSTLVIENEKYQITMLHGAYTVEIGDQVRPGDEVGTESNLGNTYDWAGNSCRGRDCGYHTHLNIFDKELGSNINPLELYYGPERAATLSN